MASVITDHGPRGLAAELNGLLDLDWPTVWAGIPADETKRGYWCEGFGWQPLWFQSGLWVRTRTGARLHLASVRPGRPVTGVSYTAWQVRADVAAENASITTAAEEHHAACLAALREILGPPDPPGDQETAKAPHRLARWTFRTPEAPDFELGLHVAPGMAEGWGPGSATISLTCRGQADPGTPQGPGWRL
ncbi:hypothetical protein OHA27_03215 [Streptomyces sp. NBC_01619]|uniref:hypothetical protein n=1 Tax=Streptomyces sp. NBC_01619 TaxID=2975901 RepID=UPI0022586476|nr:hypothetical protein [Streptomyces sp. NBC_01619]MCX4509327.1 hypothetical protein [Streptomyces sp. NBC_01619]